MLSAPLQYSRTLCTNMLANLSNPRSCGLFDCQEFVVLQQGSYSAVQPLRARYSNLFTPDTDTMRRFFAQEDRLRVFQFVLDCLDLLHIEALV